jgi:hypothetical protein
MEHSEIAGMLSGQLQELLNAYASVADPAGLPTKIPTRKRVAVQTFSQQLGAGRDASHVATLIQLDRVGAESFLTLAKYAVDFYSKNRNLTTVPFSDNGRRFGQRFLELSQLIDCYMVEIERGAKSPFE